RSASSVELSAPGHLLINILSNTLSCRIHNKRQLHDFRLRLLGPERPRGAWGRHIRPTGAALLGDAALRHRAGRDPGLSNILLAAPLMAPPPVVSARVLRVVFDVWSGSPAH